MNKILILLVLLTALCVGYAEPTYYPTSVLAEDFSSVSCNPCLDANAGLDFLHSNYNNGEFISARYYMQSGEYSNADSDARAAYYNVSLYPTVIFNGKSVITGGGENVANGTTYMTALKSHLYYGSPVKMEWTAFNPVNGQGTCVVTMISPSYSLNAQDIKFLLIENDLTGSVTHVTRDIISNTISLSGEGSAETFNVEFPIQPAYNTAHLWVAAFIQLQDKTIIQSASSLSLPSVYLRVAADWSFNIVGPGDDVINSQPFYLFNLGIAQDYTIRIHKVDAPSDWWFNFCSEDGNCFPGEIWQQVNLSAGETAGFHLSLITGTSGIAHFQMEINSPQLGTYIIPFRFVTDDVANDDQVIAPQSVKLLGNYPNPFSRTTKLKVESVKQNQPLNIEVFNIKGQKVASLDYKNLNSGVNAVIFDAQDLPNGVYFYRLAGNRSTTHKMLIIK